MDSFSTSPAGHFIVRTDCTNPTWIDSRHCNPETPRDIKTITFNANSYRNAYVGNRVLELLLSSSAVLVTGTFGSNSAASVTVVLGRLDCEVLASADSVSRPIMPASDSKLVLIDRGLYSAPTVDPDDEDPGDHIEAFFAA
jgi:hypothetical protein